MIYENMILIRQNDFFYRLVGQRNSEIIERGCAMKRLMLLFVGSLIGLLMFTNHQAVAAETYKPTSTVGASRTVGAFRFILPSNWTALSKADLRDARREMEGLIKPSYAGPATLESFEYFLLPDNSGMFLAWTIRIPEQKDFLATIQKREAANVETYRRQGQIKGGRCEVIKVSGSDVVRVEVDRVNGAKSINFHHWSSEAPGIISVLQLGLRPTRSAKVESDARAMFDSLAVVSQKAR